MKDECAEGRVGASGAGQDGRDPQDTEVPGPLRLRMSSMENGVRCAGGCVVTAAYTGTDMSMVLRPEESGLRCVRKGPWSALCECCRQFVGSTTLGQVL